MRKFLFAFMRSFGYAFEGLVAMWRTQLNARVQVITLGLVILAGWFLDLSFGEWLSVVLISTLVLALEAMNTALEALVDLVSPEFHPLAKRAKDLAAAAVLIAAIGALVVAGLIAVPRFQR